MRSSSETQGQIKGTRETLNGRENVARRKVLFFVSYIFLRPFRLSLAPFICPWVSEDDLRSVSNFTASISPRSIRQILKDCIDRSSGREKENSCLVFTVLHKTSRNYVLSSRSRATTAKECTNKRDAHAKLLFCLSKRVLKFPVLVAVAVVRRVA